MSYKELKTIEDVFKQAKIDLNGLDKHFEWMPEHRRAFAKIQFILETVVEAINEGWVADWSNTKQEKWYPWWDFKSKKSGFGFAAAGFGFAAAGYDYGCTGTDVGSRLVFKNKEKAEHAAEFFIDLYKEYYMTYGTLNNSKQLVLEAVNGETLTEAQYEAIAQIINQK